MHDLDEIVAQYRLENSPHMREALLLKKRLLLAGDPRHAEIRPLLLLLAGGIAGAKGAGFCCGLHLLGLGNIFDFVHGVSTGAGIGAYFLGGCEQMFLGASIYKDECCKGFINRRGLKVTVDTDYLMRVIAGSHSGSEQKRLDLDAMRRHRSEFFVGATRVRDGESLWFNVKEHHSPLIPMQASLAIPGISRFIEVGGELYTDGALSAPFPIEECIERLDPTHVLIVSNFNSFKRRPVKIMLEQMMVRKPLRPWPHLRQLIASRRDRFREGIRKIPELSKRCEIALFWPPNSNVGQLTANTAEVRQATEDALKVTLATFGRSAISYRLP